MAALSSTPSPPLLLLLLLTQKLVLSWPSFWGYLVESTQTHRLRIVCVCPHVRRSLRPYGCRVSMLEPTLYRTNLSSRETVGRALERAWNQADPEIKQEHGQAYYDRGILLPSSILLHFVCFCHNNLLSSGMSTSPINKLLHDFNFQHSTRPKSFSGVPDFGSGSGRNPAIFTNPAEIRLRPKCGRISVFGRICKTISI